ncbi:TPA: hypothetical protein QHD31_005989 [Raoultella ornithinolytica]|nr:hypothetical protein [Raoultella ornithinolytica]
MNKLTVAQAVVISAYTGVLMCDINDLHRDIEIRLGYNIRVEAIRLLSPKLKQIYHDDFMNISAFVGAEQSSL